MYNLLQIAAEKDELQRAVLHARAYKPIYVKIKINYGCNLKCERMSTFTSTGSVQRPSFPHPNFTDGGRGTEIIYAIGI
ncbi:MAG: hypothetical protein IT314_10595 [Anaerolineales bacterium]|nr:hypothetical protein [Anaerolineales bacterium]